MEESRTTGTTSTSKLRGREERVRARGAETVPQTPPAFLKSLVLEALVVSVVCLSSYLYSLSNVGNAGGACGVSLVQALSSLQLWK